MDIQIGQKDKKNEIDQSVFYHLIHQYMLTQYQNKTKDIRSKVDQLRKMGHGLGRNIIEIITEDLFDKFKEDPKQAKYLEHVKFICREFWKYIFGQSVTRVQHDMKGKFFITDSEFKLLKKISSKNIKEVKEYFLLFKVFLEGLLEGAFDGLSINTTVDCAILNDMEADLTFTVQMNEYPGLGANNSSQIISSQPTQQLQQFQQSISQSFLQSGTQ